MKIGSKIALFYTLISVLTTVIIIAVFYIFSTQYINKLYASYLREKAYLTAQKHWEKDEVDESSYEIIRQEYEGLLLAEVEFPSQEEAESYCPPDWFGEDVTFSVRYHNSTLSRGLTEK